MIKDRLYKSKQKIFRFFREMKPKYKRVNKFFVQKMNIKLFNNRIDFFIENCKDKSVLHFGCTDWPIFNPNNNLHISLSKHTTSIDGFDIDIEGIENLKKYVNQNYFSDYSKVYEQKYDICLVPETIEHVGNVEDFLNKISKINASKFLITAPNCFSKERLKNYYKKNKLFIEVVHPDHNCWYSPYTLKNQIEKYSTLKVMQIYLLENESMICCEAIKV
jgi:2-polyprenyl-3-methyl-5-hydroxy-6-metoxy-1,4-benzoquinol methylase